MEMIILGKYLKLEQRKIIEDRLSSGVRPTDIADELGISISTIYREIRRVPGRQYSAYLAQIDYIRKGKNKGVDDCLSKFPELAETLAVYIREKHMSPEKVIEAINADGRFAGAIRSANTIYGYVFNGKLPGVTVDDLPNRYTVQETRKIRDTRYSRGRGQRNDILVDQTCLTCRFGVNNICCGHGVRSDINAETYGSNIKELLDLFPYGCSDYEISEGAFKLQERLNGR